MAEPSYETQRLPIASVRNIRQLGGYEGVDGRRVVDGLLIRSGSLATLTPEDARTLAEDYRLRHVVDFRTRQEQGRKPDVVPPGATLHGFAAMDDATYGAMTQSARNGIRGSGGDAFLDAVLPIAEASSGDELTRDFVGEGPAIEAYRGLFDVLLANGGEGAVLWHCSQGKDRAGVASALVLGALGASVDTIVADYALSGEAYAPVAQRARAYARERGLDAELTRRLLGYAACGFPDTLRSTLAELIRAHGSLEGYLGDALGIDGADIALLREAYLEPAR